MVMNRRSFLQVIGGAIAAVFAPVVAAEQVKRLIAFPPPRLAMSFLNTEYGQSIPITPPETVAELRAAIESRYETVHEHTRAAYEETDPLISGFGMAQATHSVERNGPIYKGYVIAGEGASEKEAVANAFKSITWGIGGKEMMWRVAPRLTGYHDFASNRSWVEVRGRVIVLR